jgi:hypothetical protein
MLEEIRRIITELNRIITIDDLLGLNISDEDRQRLVELLNQLRIYGNIMNGTPIGQEISEILNRYDPSIDENFNWEDFLSDE